MKPGSPAAKAGLKPGDVINSMTVKPSKSAKSAEREAGQPGAAPRHLNFDDESPTWVARVRPPADPADDRRRADRQQGSQPVPITPEPDPDWFNPLRGLEFLTLPRQAAAAAVASALRRGFDDTVENILSIYAMFRSLARAG